MSFDETLLTVEGAGAAPETTTETAERLEAWRAFTFSNVRFVVEAGAALRFGSDITRGASSKSLSFEGIERQVRDPITSILVAALPEREYAIDK